MLRVNPADSADHHRLAALHRELGIPVDYALQRGLAMQREASESGLVTIAEKPDGTSIRLIFSAATAWQALHVAAQADGIELLPQSGFRSIARQAEIIREKLAAGRTIEEILISVAAPGFSEHHTGKALDLVSPDAPELEEDFGRTPAFAWLTSHAESQDFTLSYPKENPHGFVYEPWHWYWRG